MSFKISTLFEQKMQPLTLKLQEWELDFEDASSSEQIAGDLEEFLNLQENIFELTEEGWSEGYYDTMTPGGEHTTVGDNTFDLDDWSLEMPESIRIEASYFGIPQKELIPQKIEPKEMVGVTEQGGKVIMGFTFPVINVEIQPQQSLIYITLGKPINEYIVSAEPPEKEYDSYEDYRL